MNLKCRSKPIFGIGYGRFMIVVGVLILIWSLTSFWIRFLDNLAFITFNLDPQDTVISFWLALSYTFILFFIVWVIKELIYDGIDKSIVGKDKTGKAEATDPELFKDVAIRDIFSPTTFEPGVPIN